jgi:hypothetical protein
MSSPPLLPGTTGPIEAISLETARNLALVTPQPGEAALPSAAFQSSPTQSPLAWVRDYWWSGIVVGLVVFDGLVLLLAFYDSLRFVLRGLSLTDAWTFAWEAVREGEFVVLAATVFAVFLVALPALSALFLAWIQHREQKKHVYHSVQTRATPDAKVQASKDSETGISPGRRVWTDNNRPHFLRRGGKGVFLLHLLLAGLIAVFTVVAQSMETLSGWSKGEAYAYSFSSSWLLIVLYLKLAYPGYFLPVFRKFFVRAAGGEHPSIREVGREVMTEDGFRG